MVHAPSSGGRLVTAAAEATQVSCDVASWLGQAGPAAPAAAVLRGKGRHQPPPLFLALPVPILSLPMAEPQLNFALCLHFPGHRTQTHSQPAHLCGQGLRMESAPAVMGPLTPLPPHKPPVPCLPAPSQARVWDRIFTTARGHMACQALPPLPPPRRCSLQAPHPPIKHAPHRPPPLPPPHCPSPLAGP
jgi:hypothetical protein